MQKSRENVECFLFFSSADFTITLRKFRENKHSQILFFFFVSKSSVKALNYQKFLETCNPVAFHFFSVETLNLIFFAYKNFVKTLNLQLRFSIQQKFREIIY